MKKIAILGPKKEFFGATIVQIPFFQSLRKAYPDAEIVLYSSVKVSQLIKTYQLVDNVVFEEEKGFLSFIKSLKSFKPDCIINMRPFSEKTAIANALVPAKIKIGFTRKKKKAKGSLVFQDVHKYIAYSYLDLLGPLKIHQDTKFEYFKEITNVSALRLDHSKLNLVFIVAGGEIYKRWGIENFLELTEQLGSDKFRYHFVLGKGEEDYINKIKGKNLSSYEIHEGRTVHDLAQICTQSDLVISNDCGPSHIAQLTRCKYLSLWSWGPKPLFPRFGEWFFPHDNAYTLMGETGETLPELKVSRVAQMAKGLLGLEYRPQKNYEMELTQQELFDLQLKEKNKLKI